ncbi:MAG: pyridoxamine 5'-phosphate oxidase family protein [Ectothiorhodospiraceae bacterium]|nr:pyridoxamine 5'-phosphate oxidase family protein [Chromatiales bacterium]MCP5154351.1 pyridoxamine 5'-phosphate oxidase family protein [Ectothiorhodospiraceae bacterium]
MDKIDNLADPRVQRAINGERIAVLATVQPDGGPLAMPMWFVFDEESIGMVSVDRLRKVHNIRRDPRVCVTVDGGARDATWCVIVQGRAEFVTSAGERHLLAERFLVRYGATLESRWGGRTVPADRTFFRIVPERITAWGLPE